MAKYRTSIINNSGPIIDRYKNVSPKHFTSPPHVRLLYNT